MITERRALDGTRLQEMPDELRAKLRKRCLSSLFSFCVAVMGYDDITPELHGAYCAFLENDIDRKQVTLPRSFVKTWIGSIAYPIWITLPRSAPDEYPAGVDYTNRFWQLGSNMRILVASYVISNAEKMLSLIRKTYESNIAMQILFPEVIPFNFNKTRWSNESACINRSENFTESTFEAAGTGGASISRHYDLVIEDDLIYAKKDDLSGRELQPDNDDIDKAIGWHKMVTSLLVPGTHTRIYNIGTRWAKKDLVNFIQETEPSYKTFTRGAVNIDELDANGGDWTKCTPTWKTCYDIPQLQRIADAQGSYIFATQYLLRPSSPEEHLFKRAQLQLYRTVHEIPKEVRIFTTVDLSQWSEPSRKSDCNGVVLTCAWDSKNHCWIMAYDVGRFNPTQIIHAMAKHWKRFSPEAIGVESVYYQKALAHFAREYMDEGKIPRMRIAELSPEGNVSKEVRIMAIEPYASTFALHCREDHKEFMTEFEDYIPNSRLCKKDILDALAYQIQIARPGQVIKVAPVRDYSKYQFVVTGDDVLKLVMNKKSDKNIFGQEVMVGDPEAAEYAPDLTFLLN